MCGLAGAIFFQNPSSGGNYSHFLERMCDAMKNRGPDAIGYWRSPDFRVQLCHRRLSIVDLDSRANQPFVSACENYVLTFNGEIYNYRELREELQREGVCFRTESDTEVVLNLYIHYGSAMLTKLRGMFAIAIWDSLKKSCFFARDPYGIKPLYVAKTNGGWLFASQVKALLASGMVNDAIDSKAETSFWMLGSVAGPNTWYRDISEIPPGCWAEIGDDGELSKPEKYWEIGESWATDQIEMDAREVQERVRQALLESVKYHLVADVPVGVFLSGGVDSGALAGLMVECGARQLTGVTIAYDEFFGTNDDEAPIAAQIARHYDINHVIRRVTRAEFEADLPQIMASMDQPSIDGINTWYASKAVAENGLKVVVSGVGGDELFLGYDSFRRIPPLVKAAQITAHMPGGLALANMMASMQAKRTGKQRWKHAAKWLQTIEGGWWLRRSICEPEELFGFKDQLMELTHPISSMPELWLKVMAGKLPKDPVLALAQIESKTYLRNQLLRDSDWASMAHSIELRTPLVDAHLLKRLAPLLSKFKKFPNKTLLAYAPNKPLPQEIVNRKKTGFGIPVKHWIKEIDNGLQNPHMSWMQRIIDTYQTSVTS